MGVNRHSPQLGHDSTSADRRTSGGRHWHLGADRENFLERTGRRLGEVVQAVHCECAQSADHTHRRPEARGRERESRRGRQRRRRRYRLPVHQVDGPPLPCEGGGRHAMAEGGRGRVRAGYKQAMKSTRHEEPSRHRRYEQPIFRGARNFRLDSERAPTPTLRQLARLPQVRGHRNASTKLFNLEATFRFSLRSPSRENAARSSAAARMRTELARRRRQHSRGVRAEAVAPGGIPNGDFPRNTWSRNGIGEIGCCRTLRWGAQEAL